MCGISGIYLNKGTSDVQKLKAAVEKMNQSQARRGPDDEGIFISINQPLNQHKSASVALGHRRLSILDLSEAGHQPMIFNMGTSDVPNIDKNNFRTSDVQKLVITYNGEIYNFLELRKDLERKGYKFKTKTDTEVILALYSEYGEKSFSMLRGMFAFGLWDEKNKKLFLVKDRYGIKPLYYYSDKEKLIFASTVRALAKSGLVPIEKNPEVLIGFLLFGSVPLPITTIKNVFAVPAGHYLVREADGSQKLVQYYYPLGFFNARTSDVHNIDNNLGTSDVQNIVSKTRALLEDSICHHLISDAPLGVFLSGGLDSSVIAALTALNFRTSDVRNIRKRNLGTSDVPNIGNQRLKTLSIIFDEKEFSEEYYSDLVAKKINSDHRKIKITKQDFYDSFDEIFEAMDQPTIDGVNTFFIAKAAKQVGLKTVLSGLGADEIFCGYPYFRKAKMLRRAQKLFSIYGHRKSIGLAMSRILNLFGDRYSKLNYFINNDILSFYLGIRGLFSPKQTAKILDVNESEVENFIDKLISGTSDVPSINVNIRTSEVQKLNPVDLLSYLELKFYLQNQLLKDTDFMSMHHSVEVRVPFLDHLLVEYLSSLPSALKLKNLKTQKLNKPLLVESVRDLLPQEIFTRPKMGFTFPFQKWLRQGLPLEVQKFKSGKTHWSRFWAKVVLDKFL